MNDILDILDMASDEAGAAALYDPVDVFINKDTTNMIYKGFTYEGKFNSLFTMMLKTECVKSVVERRDGSTITELHVTFALDDVQYPIKLYPVAKSAFGTAVKQYSAAQAVLCDELASLMKDQSAVTSVRLAELKQLRDSIKGQRLSLEHHITQLKRQIAELGTIFDKLTTAIEPPAAPVQAKGPVCICPHKIDGLSIKIYRKEAKKECLNVSHIIVHTAGGDLRKDDFGPIKIDPVSVCGTPAYAIDPCAIHMGHDIHSGDGEFAYAAIAVRGRPSISSIDVYGPADGGGYDSRFVGWWVALCDGDIIVKEKQIDVFPLFTLQI